MTRVYEQLRKELTSYIDEKFKVPIRTSQDFHSQSSIEAPNPTFSQLNLKQTADQNSKNQFKLDQTDQVENSTQIY